MRSQLTDILFLDIETVPLVADYASLDEKMQTQWTRKAGLIKKKENQSDDELFYQSAGIYAEFGKIVAIAVGKLTTHSSGEYKLTTKCLSSHHEEQILKEFKKILEKMEPHNTRLCAHNGKEFDFPYLSRRMLINGIALPKILDMRGKKPWETPHIDTLNLWKFGDYKHYTSLDLLTHIFNIPGSKNTMDGSQVCEVYYQEKNLDKICEYCVQDVIALTQLYLRMHSHPLISNENIIQSE